MNRIVAAAGTHSASAAEQAAASVVGDGLVGCRDNVSGLQFSPSLEQQKAPRLDDRLG